MIRRVVTALLGAGLVSTVSATAPAQWATPVGMTRAALDAKALPGRPSERVDPDRPRTAVVAPVAAVFGIAGGVAGFYAAEQSCTRTAYECWDHFLYVPLGYVLGVALGGGIAGSAERCPTGILRSTGGALLGFVAGAAAASVVQDLGIIILPVAPVVGATWLVTRCRTGAPTANASGGG